MDDDDGYGIDGNKERERVVQQYIYTVVMATCFYGQSTPPILIPLTRHVEKSLFSF